MLGCLCTGIVVLFLCTYFMFNGKGLRIPQTL